ncbi:hypothetical protein ARMSODRAFT_1083303 [Armillaria solidipes]|uniref:RRM domain-containing protein n=1 Tax=Armillaria solidipes TaxID=1076256 RepID=A0A2H3BYC5_9AGAR|nr:hypothetical protein ARMSODRAFT_1083303 [Armillaria solidipes]
MPRILFVSGFHPSTRARDLAYEFERFGPLVRCDVPAPRNPHASSNPRLVPPSVNTSRYESSNFAREFFWRRYSACRNDFHEPKRSTYPRTPRSYAFVEFRQQRDAEDAYYDMHGRYFEGSRLSIQWAKNPPSSVWRYERRTSPPHRRDRSRSPRRRDDRDERAERMDRDRGDRDRDRDRDRHRRSRSPDRRPRSPSPERRRDDRARTPPPLESKYVEPKLDDRDRDRDRAQTPPYDH